MGRCYKCLRETNELALGICSACSIADSIKKQSQIQVSASTPISTPISKSYDYPPDFPWYESSLVWFWLFVFPPVGIYGLYKAYPNHRHWLFLCFATPIGVYLLVKKYPKQKWIIIGITLFILVLLLINKNNT
ncbi:MAG: hypothetical protein P8H44_07535 [Flavobacteriaceae bacterium]|jgi:hypothetical protein|nr:hypothetical protein [Flavobacteriaceae bacterium]